MEELKTCLSYNNCTYKIAIICIRKQVVQVPIFTYIYYVGYTHLYKWEKNFNITHLKTKFESHL